ncbi:MAG TPA: SgcJ/EcaC family oxidoreductase [Gemmatales bacterium]|nr:SgcJ/EcaC family oxidoreductase [Gemmatales bacterium]
MRTKLAALAALGVAGFIGYATASSPKGQPPSAAAANDANTQAITKSAKDFSDAFNAGDAKAIAAAWTENGECREANGQTLIGRAAIEKAYADFFKNNAGTKIETLVKSVRFPSKDLAIEEGLLRQTRDSKDLPTTTAYSAIHVREGGQWKLALSIETGAGQDRLEDLEWLLGDWTGKVKDDTVKFTFVGEPKKARVLGSFTRTTAGKEPMTGSVRISLDPETGLIRSWGFEDDGAHSQALWYCDGKSWILDTRGVLADGTPTAERIILRRAAPDVITWRAVDRVVGDASLPDMPPMRLTRTSK